MSAPHTCHIDCKLEVLPNGDVRHVMYSFAPSSAAGRYQWEQNARGMTRREWRASGQDESRNVRAWNYARKVRLLQEI